MTNSLADTQDVFAIQEKIASETCTHKGATVYGPVINDVFDVAEGVPLALHWVGDR